MRRITVICTLAVILALIGCAGSERTETTRSESEVKDRKIVVGFSQLGAESDWRRSNTESMKTAFAAEEDMELIIENGQQQQNNQIRTIRRFIQQDVDYIVLAPVTEEGWDTVLKEAKDAEIPVILMDRMADLGDENLYSSWVGSDFELEGKKVAGWLKAYLEAKGIKHSDIYMVNIQGTPASTAQIGRTNSLRKAAQENGWSILAEISGDYTQSKAREVMDSLLRLYSTINVVYCENDNEALGAIEALESAGMKVGSDLKAGEVMVLSFDGVKKEAREYVLADKISCIGECNPDQGPKIVDLIRQMEAGETPVKKQAAEERLFSFDDTVATVTIEGEEYQVTPMTKELVNERSE